MSDDLHMDRPTFSSREIRPAMPAVGCETGPVPNRVRQRWVEGLNVSRDYAEGQAMTKTPIKYVIVRNGSELMRLVRGRLEDTTGECVATGFPTRAQATAAIEAECKQSGWAADFYDIVLLRRAK